MPRNKRIDDDMERAKEEYVARIIAAGKAIEVNKIPPVKPKPRPIVCRRGKWKMSKSFKR